MDTDKQDAKKYTFRGTKKNGVCNMTIEVYAALAEAEMKRKKKRQMEGNAAKKARGEWDDYGRPAVMTLEEFGVQFKKVMAGSLSPKDCKALLGMKDSTYYRYKNDIWKSCEMQTMLKQFDLVPLKYGKHIPCDDIYSAEYFDMPPKITWRKAVKTMYPADIARHNAKCYEVYLRARQNYNVGNDSIDRWKYISVCQSKSKEKIRMVSPLLPGAGRAQAAMRAWDESIKRLILSKSERLRLAEDEQANHKRIAHNIKTGIWEAAHGKGGHNRKV